MFAYCGNNPIIYSDEFGCRPENSTKSNENGKYRFVGLGAQLELNLGAYECGIEVIVYCGDESICGNQEAVVAIYVYEGVSVDIGQLLTNPDISMLTEDLSLALLTNVNDGILSKKVW